MTLFLRSLLRSVEACLGKLVDVTFLTVALAPLQLEALHFWKLLRLWAYAYCNVGGHP